MKSFLASASTFTGYYYYHGKQKYICLFLRSVKTGAWQVSQLTGEEEPPMSIAGHVDVSEQYNLINLGV